MSQTPRPVAQGWLDVIREGQRQTAEAHTTFQRALSDAHIAFLQAFEHTTAAMTSSGTSLASSLAPASLAQPISEPFNARAAAPVVVPGPERAPAVVASPVVASPVVAPPVVAVVQAASAPVAVKPALDLTALLLEVVATKTGYPKDALDLSMALEADLGVDSIKRVEILGALREQVPSLPDIDAVQAAQLVTLEDIARAVGSSVPSAATQAAPSVAAAAPALDLTSLLLDVVAAKTGYPKDALSLSMALEADLGVDSIKRVEILGALREQVPSLPDIGTVQAAQLVTLDDIARAVGPAAAASAAPVPTSQSTVDITSLLLDVVAEKTGYPKDALSLSMALEADLGVDSIKRVEILGALRDKVPSLPDIDAVQAAQLVTLDDIARAVGSSVAPAVAPVAVASPAVAVDVTSLLLDVVAEKTGYHKDALDLSMALEADLGVDSIKRVEILGALRDQVPSLPDIDAVQAAQLVTLEDIARAVGSAAPAVQTSRAPTAPTPSVDVNVLLLKVVAEKTCYPVDALELTMALEEDLGVDSIKRVEILGALRDEVPSLPDIDAVQAAQLVTLADIVRAIGPAAAAAEAPLAEVIPLAQVATPPEERTTARRAVQLERRPARPAAEPRLRKAPLAIFDDVGAIGNALVSALNTRGVQAQVVPQDLRNVDVNAFGGLVIVGGIGAGAALDGHELAKNALGATQKFAPVLRDGGVLIAAIDLDGTLGVHLNDDVKHRAGAIAGLVKTASLEWSKLAAKVIDVDTRQKSAADVALALAEEMDVGFGDLEVALADARRVPVLIDL